MNINKILIYQITWVSIALSGQAQGTFQNLDFEQADPIPVAGSPFYPYVVTAASALPSWTVTIGGLAQTQVNNNLPSTGSPEVVLFGPPLPNPNVIDGNYSVWLQGANSAVASISQTGLIPTGTETLLFKAVSGNGALGITIGNNNVPFYPISNGPNYTLFAANISAWAGKTEQLTFSAEEGPFSINNWDIDDISFSPTAVVPEPSPLALTVIGGLLFGLYRRVTSKLQS
jgi:hypothetical protein